jgi:hypothetical protein
MLDLAAEPETRATGLEGLSQLEHRLTVDPRLWDQYLGRQRSFPYLGSAKMCYHSVANVMKHFLSVIYELS